MSMYGWHDNTLDAEKVNIGKSGEEVTLLTPTSRLFSAYSTSALTSGTVVSMTVSQTMTVASSGNQIEVAQFILTSNVKTGEWANAILAKIDYSTSGLAHGIAGVVCAELDLPGSTVTRGTYCLWESEINCPASCNMGGNPIVVMRLNSWGSQKAQFDTVGYLWELTGISSGASNLWYDHQGSAPANVEEWIRVKTPGGVRYLALYNAVV
jgi:hypothetical protein